MFRIILTKNQIALVDDEDYELVSQYKWHTSSKKGHTFYAVAYAGGGRNNHKQISMHRLIMGASFGEEVDHINGNGLDNRKENLRLASRAENVRNKHISSGTSSYKGVSLYRRTGRWRAQIEMAEKNIHLGYFKTEKEAARAYNYKALELFGDFACINEGV